MEIRERVKNVIYNALNYDFFCFEDFDIVESSRYGCALKISHDKYYLDIRFDESESKWKILFSPGKILMEDITILSMSNFENRIVQVIQSWLELIKEDLLNPLESRFINNSIHEFKTEIDNRLNEMEDSYFTKEEGDRLKEKLDQIEKMVADRSSQDEMQSDVLKMKEEIEFLKQTIDTLTKKKWLKNALVKMWSWGQKEENRKLIEAGIETVKAISQIDIPKM